MLETVRSWNVSVDRGPDWLFIRLEPTTQPPADYSTVAEQVWQVVQQHFIYRVVLELEGLTTFPSSLIGQLVLLHKRLHTQGGVLRLCGLSDQQEQAIQCSRLDARFPAYPNREQAVWGHRPAQPR
jgi:anti-anti-sigma factor